MTDFDTWESYFYPTPDNATLRNLLGERDPAVLAQKEHARAAWRQRQLNTDPSLIAHTYDAEHLRAIHRYLFQDVYEWAGEYRTQNMSKPGMAGSFAEVKTGAVDRYLGDAQRLAQQAVWERLDREQFGAAAAAVFAHVNQAHPFREGNGRCSKVFMEHVAQLSRFTLDFARVSPRVWNQASALSGPDLGKYEVVPDSLVPVFRHIAVERFWPASSDLKNAEPRERGSGWVG